MFDLGVFLYFRFLLIGGFSHLFHIWILDPVHQLDVLLQHQPLGEGPPGVRAVPAGHRQGEATLLQCMAAAGGAVQQQTASTSQINGSGSRTNKQCC